MTECTDLLSSYVSLALSQHYSCPLYVINCNPHVSFLRFRTLSILEKRSEGCPSIAIWNKDKAIAALVAGIWIVNVAFLIQGKSPSTFLQTNWSPSKRDIVARPREGEGSTPDTFDLLGSFLS